MNRKRVQRLVRQMGLRALYPKPRTSQPGVGHTVYPYLLRGLSIERPNQVWATDICYIPMAHGFMYLVAIMDWYSRRVLAWRVSNTFDSDFCLQYLHEVGDRVVVGAGREAVARARARAGNQPDAHRTRRPRGRGSVVLQTP